MRLRSIVAASLLVATALPDRLRAQDAPPAPTPVPVDESPDARAAREHYQQGLTHYHVGHFGAAVDEFKKAYELSKKPGLLFNIAQAYRLGHDWANAIYFYRTYLRLLPEAPNRADVEEFIEESEVAAQVEKDRVREAQEAEQRELVRIRERAESGRRARRVRSAGFITAGGGIVLAGTGAIFAARAQSAEDDLDALAASNGQWSDAYASIAREGERDDVIATSLIVGGALALVVGGALVAWGVWHDEPPPANVSIEPSGAGGASLWVGWDF